jgi:hypothetical protein
MILYRGPVSAREMLANATPAERLASLEAWRAWGKKVGYALSDFGTPLGHTAHVGPGAASTDGVSGYSILEAGSADEVGTLLDGHPHLAMPGSSIEVLEVIPVENI